WLIQKALSLGQSLLTSLGLGGEQQDQQGGQSAGSINPFDVGFAETSAALDAQLSGSGVNVNEALPRVGAEMSGMGLKSLRLEPSEDGGGRIVASVNPTLTLAELTAGREKSQMTCQVRVEFAGAPAVGTAGQGWNTANVPSPSGNPTTYDY